MNVLPSYRFEFLVPYRRDFLTWYFLKVGINRFICQEGGVVVVGWNR